jgi:outer membrane protein assembly factor BamE (lipoprotein component of BamABCDE complex)
MVMRQSCTAVAVILAAGITAGCSFALAPTVVVDGQSFPVERTMQLRAGMSQSEVEALVGSPFRRSGGVPVVWHYEFTRRPRQCRPYVGPIPLQPGYTERHALELTFGVDGLERAVYREVVPDRTTERLLVR